MLKIFLDCWKCLFRNKMEGDVSLLWCIMGLKVEGESMVTLFGVDPGSLYTGFGVLKKVGESWRFCDGGRLNLGKGKFSSRMLKLYEAMSQLMQQHMPHTVVLEEVFVAKNAQSALKLGHARGVAMLAAAQTGARIVQYPTRVVKKAMTGTGSAQKAQMQFMVRRLLNLEQVPSEDEADALALALMHAHTLKMGNCVEREEV